MMWRLRQEDRSARATGKLGGADDLARKLGELKRMTTTTRTPAIDNYYEAGRANLEMYEEGFSDIRGYTYASEVTLKNARLTDAEIMEIIERMNLTPR